MYLWWFFFEIILSIDCSKLYKDYGLVGENKNLKIYYVNKTPFSWHNYFAIRKEMHELWVGAKPS